ncbi:fused MFS/spermidine synthase [Jannaschia ovalis]|uniref:Fused MFS/spermidine synthase n=1 Tax=Jannaschia ovalis TaxID=3038773 RepID=A0ABY8LAC0_9RHOB|nr:fused MFS/spermidine synthase [Jannaschia sp. GRR-S6-38]WGH78246.1 fused MFS/spermidine synthase [Jannaschia sp. GRR-S6-38]
MTDASSAAPIAAPKSRRLPAAAIFTLTIFLSASLLFLVQPLFAKLVLPLLGGAPAVWTTAMLFFQTVLIGGYLYAHLLVRYVPQRGQLAIHLCIWGAALIFLPLSVPAGWTPEPGGSLPWQTLMLFAAGVGVPFAMLSANAPLIQAWYARSDGPSADDPYFLYAASNAGSLISLLAFPLLAEPFLGGSATGLVWSAGFVLLGGMVLASGLLVRRTAPARAATAEAAAPAAPIDLKRVALWLGLAFVPSSTMLVVTTKISIDLGSIPLVWAVPLSLYILTFVLTFTNRPLISDRAIDSLFIVGLAILAFLSNRLMVKSFSPLGAVLLCLALFFIAMKAHRALYKARPEAARLTVFYVVMSVGGALGGLFNSLLAPALFDTLLEIPLTVIAVSLLVLGGPIIRAPRAATWGITIAALALALATNRPDGVQADRAMDFILAAVVLLGLWFGRRMPLSIPVAVTALAVGTAIIGNGSAPILQDRSFFGAHVVRDANGLRLYTNGTTIHGMQWTGDEGRLIPRSYYHPRSPMAQMVTDPGLPADARIGVVGLGIGALACYAEPGQSWDFYEIDAEVIRIATDRDLFTFMPDCAPDAPIHLGDARLVLERQAMQFDVLVLDAYSSDSVPVHLLTAEAMAIYLDRLAPEGRLVFHISNRYYDLLPPLSRLARDAGLQVAYREATVEPGIDVAGANGSQVAVMSRNAASIAELAARDGWVAVPHAAGAAWTDDHANLLGAIER